VTSLAVIKLSKHLFYAGLIAKVESVYKSLKNKITSGKVGKDYRQIEDKYK
jgi:hypothetical protein